MIFAGIDGGGTRTRCLITDADGRPLSQADGGPSNFHELGPARSARVVSDIVRTALRATGRERLVAAACISGLDTVESEEAMRAALDHEMPEVEWHTSNDAAAAWAAAFPDDDRGTVVISGTGAIALARNGPREARAGGWGPRFGDPGSGYDIGQRGLTAVLRSADGLAPATALTSALLKVLGLDSAHQIVDHAHFSMRPTDIAALAPTVLEQSDLGDSAARLVATDAAKSVVELATAARTNAGIPDDEPSRLALMGGLAANRHFARIVEFTVARAEPRLLWLPTRTAPAIGATYLARRYADRFEQA